MHLPADQPGMDSRVSIREFEPGDEEAFKTLNEEWITRIFGMEEHDRVLLENVHEEILGPGGKIIFAVMDGKCVGCCALVRKGEREYEVSKMGVTLACQGKGVGRALLRAVVEAGRVMGARRLYLETNHVLEAAQQLYASEGFKPTDPSRMKASPYARADVFMEMMLE